MAVSTLHTALRPRSYVSVNGPDAASYLNRMVSNDVETLAVDETCEALLLTPKARVVAPLVVWRRKDDDFLLLTEPEAGDRVVRELLRSRFAAKCQIALEEHRSVVVLGADRAGFRRGTTGFPQSSWSTPTPRRAPSRSARRSSSACGSSPGRRGSAASWTTG